MKEFLKIALLVVLFPVLFLFAPVIALFDTECLKPGK